MTTARGRLLTFGLIFTSLLLVICIIVQVKHTTDRPTAEAGYVRVDTVSYTLEIPNGWHVGNETPWGAREITPMRTTGKGNPGSMSAMTAHADTWDTFYKTALSYILHNYPPGQVRATTYVLARKQGTETCSWSIVDRKGGLKERYVVLKNDAGKVLALSVKIPSVNEQKRAEVQFQHLVDTAILH